VPTALIVSRQNPEPDLGQTVLWRGDVERVWVKEPSTALEAAAKLTPSLVVVDGADSTEASYLTRSLRFHEATRSTAVAVLDRSLTFEAEAVLLAAGATVVLPVPVDPLLWDRRLEELVNVPPRREARIPVRFAAWSRQGPNHEEIEGVCLNISLRGMLLETKVAPPLGTKLDIDFRLPGDRSPVRVVGQVVRHAGVVDNRHRSGIAFVILRGGSRSRISAFVDFAHRTRPAAVPGPTPARELFEDAEWEAELRTSEARKSAILDSALDCVVTVDHEGRIVEFNAAAERAFGHSRSAVFGRRFVETLVPGPSRDEARRRLRGLSASAERGLPAGRFEAEALRADGSVFPVEVSVSPAFVRKRLLLTGFVRDVTEERRRDSQRQEAEERLREAQKMATLGAIVGAVAHEVRNPLFALAGTVDLIEAAHRDRPDLRVHLQRLREQIDRVSALMRDLLDYGRPAALEPTATPLPPLIQRAVDWCRALARRHHVVLQVSLSEPLPEVLTAGDRLPQAFHNLLDNAIRHSPKHGTVTIAAAPSRPAGRRRVEVVVRDSGPGMSDDELAHAFEPFFSHRHGGTGLGLPIALRIVEEHAGIIALSNAAGGGTAVTMSLPAADDPA
jgi:PAS domain S-box-containing protein